MDENRTPEELTGDEWLENFLASKENEKEKEIEADEQAVFSAGLTHPNDVELEKIMREVSADRWAEEKNAEQISQDEEDDVKEYDPSAPPVIPTEEFKDAEFRDTFGEGEDLEQAFSATTEPEAAPQVEETEEDDTVPQEESPVEKRRPKKKREYWLWGLPQLASSAIWLVIIVFIGVTVGRVVWMCAADVLAFGREPIAATVTIQEGDDMDAVAQKLKDAGLIKYPSLFKLYADITDAQEKLVPGTYDFVSQSDSGETMVYDYMALVTVLSPYRSSLVVVDDVLIPEGYTSQQIYQLLEDKNICTAAEMEHFLTVQSHTVSEGETLTEEQKADNALVAKRENLFKRYWFLEGQTLEGKYALEGYLFPNTYDFYENDDPVRIVEKLLNAYNSAFTDKMKDDLAKLNERLEEMMRKNGYGDEYIQSHRYTIREVTIIASMIEKEAASSLEGFTVSSVIYNRLTNAREYPTLDIDATLVYSLGRQEIYDTDKADASNPFNTYKNPGLPPAPISNPSQSSLAAALDPEDTVKEDDTGNPILDSYGNTIRVYYYFYALDPETNMHHFSQTYAEHKAFLDSIKEDA